MSKIDLKEHIDRMNYVSSYIISETAKYRSLNGEDVQPQTSNSWNQFEEVTPMLNVNEAPDDEDQFQDGPPAGEDKLGVDPAADAGELPADDIGGIGGEEPAGEEPTEPTDTTQELEVEPAAPPPAPAPEVPNVEDIQNDLIKDQLAAMQKLSDNIKGIEMHVMGLNSKLDKYSNDVEEVREPSDVEKMEMRGLYSHPYNNNLNDLWSLDGEGGDEGNLQKQEVEKGIYKDGDKYVGNTEEMVKMADYEIKDSFDDY